MFPEELMLSSSNQYGRIARSGPLVPMVAKVTDGFNGIFNFSLSMSWMWYGRVVWFDSPVPMVAKVTYGFDEI
jgi:hypothetical protein